jgi:hypothetical protein
MRGFLLFVTVALWPVSAWTETLSDQQIAEIIVRESRTAYYATGRPCACPEDLARNGSRCGGRSAYSRPSGASPLCYVSDVPTVKIEDYKGRTHP